MRNLNYAIFLVAILFLTSFTVSAQETEVKVVDEVVAQVNDSVITLSDINREIQSTVDLYVQDGKSREEAEQLVESKKAELVANLINERLLIQKAEENISDSAIDAQINRRLVEIMQEQNIKTIEDLYKVMEAQGFKPEDIRANFRKQIMRESVEGDIYRKVYWEPNIKKVKAYYEANKAKFTKKETVTVSEIFLSFAGKDPEAVRQKSKELTARLRQGADFEKAVLDNSDRPNKAETKGKAGTFEVETLDKTVSQAVKDVKAGGYAEIEIPEGIEIIRVDERLKASNESAFNEEAVRKALAGENFAEARKKYMTELRKDSYIKISDTWRPSVSPLLNADERKTETTSKVN